MRKISQDYLCRKDSLNLNHIRFAESCWAVFEQALTREQRQQLDDEQMMNVLWVLYDHKNRIFEGQSLSEDVVQFLTQDFKSEVDLSSIKVGTKVFTLNGEILQVEAIIKLKPEQLIKLEAPYVIKFKGNFDALFYSEKGHNYNTQLSPNTILEIVE